MILPSTTKEYMTFSMKTPRFLNRFKNHCLVYSFYFGLAGYFYTWVFTSLDPTFPERAAIMTKNDSFRDIDPLKYTPSLAYKGDPVNNRMLLIILSCVGIPLCSLFSYLGLCLYYHKGGCCIAFQKIPEDEKMAIFERLSFTNLLKQAKNLIVEEPVLEGVWMDLNYITTFSAENVDKELINMGTFMEDEDIAVLEQVKRSFPCWQAKQLKKKIMMPTNWKSVTSKSVSRVFCLLLVVTVVGLSMHNAQNLSIWWQTNPEFIYNHTHVPCNEMDKYKN